jgi:hypothetical protein
MNAMISIEKAKSELDMILAGMGMGETITLIGNDGLPVAVMVLVQPLSRKSDSVFQETREKDLFFSDNELFEGDAPSDASQCLDSYLYEEGSI